MHLLPIPLTGNRQAAFLLSDHSAQRLVSVWTEEHSDQRTRGAERLLREDAALVLWAATFFQSWWSRTPNHPTPSGTPHEEFSEFSRWARLEQFRPNWKDLVGLIALGAEAPTFCTSKLRWGDSPKPLTASASLSEWAPPAVTESLLDRLARISEKALRTGELTLGAIRTSTDGSSTFSVPSPLIDGAFLLGVLAWLHEWLEACGVPPHLLSELVDRFTPAMKLIPEIERVKREVSAAEVVDSVSSPWKSTSCQPFDWLPKLGNSFHRQRELESNFARQLLDSKLRAMKEFAYGASHEINNPLANIATRAQTLLRDEHDPERRRQLATINSQAFRAHEMISNAMLFAHPPKLEPVACDMNELLRQVQQELSESAEAQETRLELHLGLQDSRLTADRNQLTVALKNVVQNSLEAVAHGGHVSIELESPPESHEETSLSIWIRDDGPGIPPELSPHIFDPFFSGREAGRGLGLGLSKAWRIITMHGGRIDCVEANQGTTFLIQLPRRPSLADGEDSTNTRTE